MSKAKRINRFIDKSIWWITGGALFLAWQGYMKRKHEEASVMPTDGVSGLTTRELEQLVWGFGTRGRGRIHFYAEINGEVQEFENTDTISYDRIQQRDEIADNKPGILGLTYKQALERFYNYACRYGY